MIVAVCTVGMVKMTAYQIINMISMRHLFMPAVRAVSMLAIVRLALMVGRAAVRIRAADGDGMLVHMTVMHMMQVSIMEVVRMPFVADRGVTAIRTVHVTVRRMFSTLAFLHICILSN
jgi:hypothetical protein